MAGFFLAVALLWASIVPAAAAPTGWVLALSWEPGFCATHPRAAECADPGTPRLTLHGLWPEDGSAEYCGISPEIRSRDGAHRWCELPELNLSRETASLLHQTMPGLEACLDRHEWVRHGSCSGFAAEPYFHVAAKMVAQTNALALGKLLRSRGSVTRDDVDAAVVEDFGADGGAAVQVLCERRDGQTHLTEIRLSLSAEGPRLFPDPRALRPGKRAGRSCSAGALIVDR